MKVQRTPCRLSAVLLLWFVCTVSLAGQSGKAPVPYPKHLPYSFSNFVWWSDEELRALLKKRIPGLGDEVATTSTAEGRIRDALTSLLKEKGVVADVTSEEPSFSSFRPPLENMLGMGDLEVPPYQPAVIFSVLRPAVILGKVNVQSDNAELALPVEEEFKSDQGKPFGTGMISFSRYRAEKLVRGKGYLAAKVEFRQGAPYKQGGAYIADVAVAITAGPKFRISSLAVDGGPAFEGKDLIQFVRTRVGDAAGLSPFAGVGPQLKAYYEQNGYADVLLKNDQVLDAEHATVAYSLKVIPGPRYRLHSLTIEKLPPAQETKVRDLFDMKVGDIYREDAIQALYRKIAIEPLLKGYSFGYSPKPDKIHGFVDLSLDFSREGGKATVTIK